MAKTVNKEQSDAVSAGFSKNFRHEFVDILDHEITRTKIKKVIDEYIGTVEFMNTVRKYSSMEIDSRMFTSLRYWGTVILSSVVTSGIGVLIVLISQN